jgi:hypothetical protein
MTLSSLSSKGKFDMAVRQTGKIKFFNHARGFGFIQRDDGCNDGRDPLGVAMSMLGGESFSLCIKSPDLTRANSRPD